MVLLPAGLETLADLSGMGPSFAVIMLQANIFCAGSQQCRCPQLVSIRQAIDIVVYAPSGKTGRASRLPMVSAVLWAS
eukprot:3055226-Amphidinium_carterae.1